MKGEICYFAADVADYLLDVEALCGVTDDNGTVIEDSPVDTICNSWGDICINGVPKIEEMCTSLD